MNTPKITTIRFWSGDSVRSACIKNDLYTDGNGSDYYNMLGAVCDIEPTAENIFTIAKDIADHSENQTISNVMALLERDAVTTFFDIGAETY